MRPAPPANPTLLPVRGQMEDLAGQRFGRLTVLGLISYSDGRGGAPLWVARCDCGRLKGSIRKDLKRGDVKSCGCIRGFTDHDWRPMKKHPLYGMWKAMRRRCQDRRHPDYRYYGARGIYVCLEWRESFQAFVRDMGPRPVGRSIDRIDNAGPYAPWNCRWATAEQQIDNRRLKRARFTLDGRTLTMREWAERLGMDPGSLRSRLRTGWSIRDALTIPARERPRSAA